MKIVVTGGAGFIGSNFLNGLVPRHPEHSFVNLDKLTYAANVRSLAEIAEAPNYKLVRVDLADFAAVDALFAAEKPELVVHFAAAGHEADELFEQLRSAAVPREAEPPHDPERAGGEAAAGLWRGPERARLAVRRRPLRGHLDRHPEGAGGGDVQHRRAQ